VLLQCPTYKIVDCNAVKEEVRGYCWPLGVRLLLSEVLLATKKASCRVHHKVMTKTLSVQKFGPTIALK